MSFKLSGGVEVLGFISPTEITDEYPVIDPLYGIDGFRNVDTLSDLNDIPELRRRAGMVVGVSGGTEYYKLNPSPWNGSISDWSIFNSGSSGGGTFTGGTVTGDTIFTQGVTATTFSASTYLGLPLDVYVTGGTYSNGAITFSNNSGGTFDVTGLYTGQTSYVNSLTTGVGLSGNTTTGDITIINTEPDQVVVLNNGSNISVTGEYPNFTIKVTGLTDNNIYVTGFTYNNNTFTISDNSGSTFNATIDILTGLTINGNQIVTGNTSLNGVSATTLNVNGITITGDTYLTGGTYFTGGTIVFEYNNGGNFPITGLTEDLNIAIAGLAETDETTIELDVLTNKIQLKDIVAAPSGGTRTFNGNVVVSSGFTATIISATTYQNLPIDPDTYVTGFTYNDNTFSISDNSGTTFNTTINTVTGLTVNGVLSATTYQNLPQYYAGVISGSTNWIDNNDGSITLPDLQVALFNNPNFSGPLNLYGISTTTFTLNNNDTNYIAVDYNGGSPIYSLLNNDGPINDSDVILYLIIYRANNFLHILEFGNYGSGLPNKLNDRVLMTDRFAHESGCILGLSGSTGVVTLTDGVVWNGVYRQVISAVTSNDGVFFQNYHIGGNWVYTTTATTLNNQYYDNGTDLVSGTPGNYLVNWYFRGLEVNDHLYEVFGNNEYTSVPEAELSLEPLLPELITSHAFLVGRIIVGVGQTTGSTQTAFVTPFVSTQVTNHEDLLGLQGGGPGEYYHLSSNEYNNLVYTNVNNNFSSDQTINGGLTATTISVTTIGTSGDCVDDIYVSNIHSCSPLNINPLDEGNIYFGSTSGVTIDLSNNRVGIGTSTPQFKLDVSGTSVFRDYTRVYAGAGNLVSSISWLSTDSGIINLYTGGIPTVQINTNGNSYFNGGNIGIGITLPTEKLDVIGKTKTTNLQVTSGATTGYVLTSDAFGNATWQVPTITANTFTTGFTYNNNTFTISDNSGTTFNTTINSVTGLTVNGDLTVTGDSITNNFSATTAFITNTEWTLDFMDALTLDIYSPNNLSIDSIINLVNTPTITITVNNLPYILTTLINSGDKISVTSDINSVVNFTITNYL